MKSYMEMRMKQMRAIEYLHPEVNAYIDFDQLLLNVSGDQTVHVSKVRY